MKEFHKTNLVKHQQVVNGCLPLTLTNTHISWNNLLQILCSLNPWHLSLDKNIISGTTQAMWVLLVYLVIPIQTSRASSCHYEDNNSLIESRNEVDTTINCNL